MEGFGRIVYQRLGQEYRYFGEEEKAVEGWVDQIGMLGGGLSGGCACGRIGYTREIKVEECWWASKMWWCFLI
jgi:hypothetical protein